MEQNIMNTQNPNAETAEASAENTGEKMFTQEDVNRIVSERLNRAKRDSSPQIEEKEKLLAQREARLSCREYLSEQGKPSVLLDILDTSDFDKFKANVELMAEKLPSAFASNAKPTGRKVNIGASIVGTPAGHGYECERFFAPDSKDYTYEQRNWWPENAEPSAYRLSRRDVHE